MKKLLLAVAATVSAVACAPAVYAATFITENAGPDGLRAFVFGHNDVGTASTFEDLITPSTPSAGFLSLSLREVAASAINNVEFTSVFLNSSAVSLFSTPSAVPKPAAWAMMIAGFGMVGGALRSQRKLTTSATFT